MRTRQGLSVSPVPTGPKRNGLRSFGLPKYGFHISVSTKGRIHIFGVGVREFTVPGPASGKLTLPAADHVDSAGGGGGGVKWVPHLRRRASGWIKQIQVLKIVEPTCSVVEHVNSTFCGVQTKMWIPRCRV